MKKKLKSDIHGGEVIVRICGFGRVLVRVGSEALIDLAMSAKLPRRYGNPRCNSARRSSAFSV